MKSSTRYVTDEFDEVEMGLRWRFPKPGELGEDKQQSRVELSERKIREIRYRHRLISRVRQSYADVLMNDYHADLAKQRVAFEDERIGIIEHMVSTGRALDCVFHQSQNVARGIEK